MKKEKKHTESPAISRRVAIRKIGYTAATASVMMLLLNSRSARATSVNSGPTNPGDTGGSEVIWDD
jgi:hypothetical protein